jgi:hypothetical protein
VPDVVYSCEGFWAVPVLPSPKFHTQDVGDPVEVSVNWTVRGAAPLSDDAVNAATGMVGPTMMYPVRVVAFVPIEFSSVRVTEYVPLVT